MARRFYIVDVFAEHRYAGNQLAVVVGADDLSDDAMQRVARSLDALRRSRLDLETFAPLAAEGFPPLVYLFCRQTYDSANDLCARFFFDAHGVREDPATGNGAAFLGAYLLEHRLFPDSDLDLRIEQGYEIRRPSLVMLRARMVGSSREVSVGGRIIPTVQGELL